jgi:hypothetical protein
MNKIRNVGTAIILALSLLMLNIAPVLAGETGYQIVDKPFSTGNSSDTYNIPVGSTIYHLENGITKVYGPDKALLLSAKDADSETIGTPNGPTKATHVHYVPNGSYMETIDNTTKIYTDDVCILTVVEQSQNKTIAKQKQNNNDGIPDTDTNKWIEDVNASDVDDLSYFRAKWECPSYPPSPSEHGYIFNAIQPPGLYNSTILQPCLEWNYRDSGCWTGTAWAIVNGSVYPVDHSCAVNVGDEIWGVMNRSNNVWYVYLYNYTTLDSSYVSTYNAVGSDDLHVYCTLEGYGVSDDSDVPGDIEFYDILFKDSSNNDIDFMWDTFINFNFDAILSDLDVDCDQTSPFDNSWATLHTANRFFQSY